MALLYLIIAVVAGSLLPVQAAMNARLARTLGSPIWAAAVSGLLLTLALSLTAWVASREGPRTAGLSELPLWAWAGGFGGAVLLAATASLAPRLGAATLISMVVAGQILSSLAMDNFGLLGLERHPLSFKRVCAAALLLSGAALMR